MPKYQIDYTIERWYKLEIEADSEQHAREMFHNDQIDYQTNPAKDVGSELQDYIVIREVK